MYPRYSAVDTTTQGTFLQWRTAFHAKYASGKVHEFSSTKTYLELTELIRSMRTDFTVRKANQVTIAMGGKNRILQFDSGWEKEVFMGWWDTVQYLDNAFASEVFQKLGELNPRGPIRITRRGMLTLDMAFRFQSGRGVMLEAIGYGWIGHSGMEYLFHKNEFCQIFMEEHGFAPIYVARDKIFEQYRDAKTGDPRLHGQEVYIGVHAPLLDKGQNTQLATALRIGFKAGKSFGQILGELSGNCNDYELSRSEAKALQQAFGIKQNFVFDDAGAFVFAANPSGTPINIDSNMRLWWCNFLNSWKTGTGNTFADSLATVKV